jgi:hypothetical protein
MWASRSRGGPSETLCFEKPGASHARAPVGPGDKGQLLQKEAAVAAPPSAAHACFCPAAVMDQVPAALRDPLLFKNQVPAMPALPWSRSNILTTKRKKHNSTD